MAKEIRSTYPGECLFADDNVLLRVQTFGASTTLNSTDIHELGNKESVTSSDDVPTVAVTLDTFEYATLNNEAILSNHDPNKTRFVKVFDYENAKVDLYAPIIKGKDYGKTNADVASGDLSIYRTQYIEDAYVTAINHTYNVSGVSTENYTLESSFKMWLYNENASIVVATIPIPTGARSDFDLVNDIGGGKGGALTSGATPGIVATQLPDGSYTLGYNDKEQKIIQILESDGFTVAKELIWKGNLASSDTTTDPDEGYFYVVKSGSNVGKSGKEGGAKIRINDTDWNAYNDGTHTLKIRYSAENKGAYFTPNANEVGGIRHGQVQIYLANSITDANGVKKIKLDSSELYWRLQSATANATLGREAISELGHFRPFARPLTYPIPVTVGVESLDSDTELFARLSDKVFEDDTLQDGVVSIEDLVKNKNLIIKIYKYDDVMRQKIYAALNEAGGNVTGYDNTTTGFDETQSTLPAYGGSGTDSSVTVNGKVYYTHDLAPMKIIVVKKLIPTGENQNLAIGSNGTQTFDFKSDNLTEGIGAASSLCLGTNGVNEGYSVDNTEIQGESFSVYVGGSATNQVWQAFKYGIVDSRDDSDI